MIHAPQQMAVMPGAEAVRHGAIIVVPTNDTTRADLVRRLRAFELEYEIRLWDKAQPRRKQAARSAAASTLTERHFTVLRYYAEAPTVDEAARRACMSHSSIENALREVREQLGCQTNRHAILVAAHEGWI